MSRVFIFCISFFFLSKNLRSSTSPTRVGAVSSGCGQISLLFSDPFVAWNHPGNLAFVRSGSLALSIQSNYLTRGLNRVAVSGYRNIAPKVPLGVSANFFGNAYYNESEFKLSLAKKMSEKYGAGVSIYYRRNQFPVEYFRTAHGLTFEMGAVYRFNPCWQMGVIFLGPFGLYSSSAAKSSMDRPAGIVSILWKVNEQLSFGAESVQTFQPSSAFKLALEYRLSEKLTIRAGLRFRQLLPALGMSFRKGNLGVHLALEIHPYLGFSPTTALSFQEE